MKAATENGAKKNGESAAVNVVKNTVDDVNKNSNNTRVCIIIVFTVVENYIKVNERIDFFGTYFVGEVDI